MISHHSEKEVIDQKESAGSDQHRIKHQAGSCRTDQDSIPQEGGKAGKRDSQHPIEIGSGLLYDNRVIRQEGEKTFPAYSIKQGKRKGQPDPPAKQQTDHPTKGCFIPSADITPRQSLACIGKTIHDIGKERKQLHQQRINSQNDITLFCTRRSKKCSNRHQTKRTKENIAIHLEEATHSDLLGAPNIVRGQSSTKNVSAMDVAEAGCLSCLSSDYVPASLLEAVFILMDRGVMSLPEAMRLVTLNPARTAGLTDRGALKEGLRADLCLVTLCGNSPIVRGVWKAGMRVF